MYLHFQNCCLKYSSWTLYSNYESYFTKCVSHALQHPTLYISINSSRKLQNMPIDSVFHAEHESEVELWFRARNESQKNSVYFQHSLTIPPEFVNFLVLTQIEGQK